MIAVGAAVYFVFDAELGNSGGDGGAIIGPAQIVDGDTLKIHGTRIRLHGIDAPESDQLCEVEDRQTHCGQSASQALAAKIFGRTVTCDPRRRDRYDRVVAVCRSDGDNLNAWMVANGWAIAYLQYSWDYLPEELLARWNRTGLWEGDFIAPSEWRSGKRL